MDMAKSPTPTEKPKALDTLVEITEQALDFRYADKTVKLMDIGKVVIQAPGHCISVMPMSGCSVRIKR
jgi:hypothetical protein